MSNIKHFNNRYLDIFIERIKIGFKKNKEYKTDFYMMWSFDIIHMIMYMIFFIILNSEINSITNWTKIDFFLYWAFTLLAWKAWWLLNLRDFVRTLLTGQLNQYRMKPTNTFFLVATEGINGNNLSSGIILLIITYIIITTNNYSNIILGFSFMIFGWIYFISFFNFAKSFEFFMKNSDIITGIPFAINSVVHRFPPQTFKDMKFKNIIYLMPASISSYFTIEILKGNFTILINTLPIILLTFTILIIGTTILWHYGLKKYEGFN